MARRNTRPPSFCRPTQFGPISLWRLSAGANHSITMGATTRDPMTHSLDASRGLLLATDAAAQQTNISCCVGTPEAGKLAEA
jgi:hypothetical protein